MNEKKRLRQVWWGMKSRCYSPAHPRYRNYGGRGISICPEWHDFETFYARAGGRWSSGLQIDRENNDGNYCPENCRFVTCQVNNCNHGVRQDNSTGYTGVTYRANQNRFRAQIWFGSKGITIGQFRTVEEAVAARNSYIREGGLPHPIQELKGGLSLL